MASQTVNEKAFEYALLRACYKKLEPITGIQIDENVPYRNAKGHYEGFSAEEKLLFDNAAKAAIHFLLDPEPRLSLAVDKNDLLKLEIVKDKKGQEGDVRDVLTIRVKQDWQIGISAKNNHRAVKHSRLSDSIDFGEKWLGHPCSASYFESVNPIFEMLRQIKREDSSSLWTDIENMHDVVYMPILQAFRKELLRLDAENPAAVAENLVQYLIGTEDFYKVIKSKRKVEIQAYNIHGTLNQAFKKIRPKAKLQSLKLPSRLIEVVFKQNSKTTLLVSMDEGWQISFRIHNASSRVEPSLKFDINLVSTPHNLFVHHIFTE